MTNRIINLFAFSVLSLLWLAFAAALIFSRGSLDSAWEMFRSWPLLVQLVVGLLTLPVTVGLWVWETTWPVWLRLILVIGLAWVTLYTFFPRQASAPSASAPAKS
jgi:hypothetical protein